MRTGPATTSVRARLAALREVAAAPLEPASVFVSRTPCCARTVRVAEADLQHAQRMLTVRCPGCSAIWQARLYAPLMHWDR